MLTYLIILLDDTSVSYCHYEAATEKRLMPLDTLQAGIVFAMKENLNVQFIYPDYKLPVDYERIIESIDHVKIKPYTQKDGADIVVLKNWNNCDDNCIDGAVYTIHTTRIELKDNIDKIKTILCKVGRLNIILNDIEDFKDEEASEYSSVLSELSDKLIELFSSDKTVQLNLLTDRILLTKMNNCDAGYSNVTLAPNGKFYICPAFYYCNSEDSVGDLTDGLNIKNHQLLRLDYAPICRHCDAFQCKRCVWLNNKLTNDMNTPSHQQCVMAHLERNASRHLLLKMKEHDIQLRGTHDIEEINYLDPFNNYKQWK